MLWEQWVRVLTPNIFLIQPMRQFIREDILNTASWAILLKSKLFRFTINMNRFLLHLTLHKTMSKYQKIRKEAYESNMQLPELGLVIFTFGNVSAADHTQGVFAIKPSGVSYKE